jgi:hypothetical protein
MTANTPETYTGRTLALLGVYALSRKSLSCLMGLRGVEPLTSRLSGSVTRAHFFVVHSGFPRASTARHFPSEHRTALYTTSKRTQRVHGKIAHVCVSGPLEVVPLDRNVHRIHRAEQRLGGRLNRHIEREANRS